MVRFTISSAAMSRAFLLLLFSTLLGGTAAWARLVALADSDVFARQHGPDCPRRADALQRRLTPPMGGYVDVHAGLSEEIGSLPRYRRPPVVAQHPNAFAREPELLDSVDGDYVDLGARSGQGR